MQGEEGKICVSLRVVASCTSRAPAAVPSLPPQSNYVGVSNDLFAAGMACGRCITIQCDDTSCTEPGKRDLPALVADMCGERGGPPSRCTGIGDAEEQR